MSEPEGPRPEGRTPPTILYFGNDWAAENRTSSHHVARGLARFFALIYLECPGLRSPQATSRDLRKLLAKVLLFLRGPRVTPEGLRVQTLLQLPWHRFGLVRRCNRQLIRLTLRMLMWREGVSRPISWFVVPHLSAVAGTLGERLSVYYCVDDYASLPDVDGPTVRGMDEELTRKADLVFVASRTLLERKRAQNAHVHLSPHGVDFEHFVKAQDSTLPTPAEVLGLKAPIVGFFGLIERWIDLDLVAFLAERRPEWTFLMIGRVAVPENEVPRRPNLVFTGSRPYAELPSYGKAFRAAIIPYRRTTQVLHANPLKLREYLAMGKPVVSIRTPEIDAFAKYVTIASSPEEFLAGLDHVMRQGLSAAQVREQTELAATMTWDSTLRNVVTRIEERLRTPSTS